VKLLDGELGAQVPHRPGGVALDRFSAAPERGGDGAGPLLSEQDPASGLGLAGDYGPDACDFAEVVHALVSSHVVARVVGVELAA